jgi:molybdopterin-containing oxidoreductase family iron-sulfur binding subunit
MSGEPGRAEQKGRQARRQFLGRVGAAAAALALTPGLRLIDLARARPASEPASGAQRWGMLIDANKCASGCDACVRACNTEHALQARHGPATDAQWIRKVELRDRQSGASTSLPLMCQHCEHPPCVDVCPTGASFRRADGIVLVDKHTCIGCRYCMMACPYKARSFIHERLDNQKSYAPRGKGTVESCTLCVHRIDEGRGRLPACAEACTADGHRAMLFGDMNDAESDLAKALAKNPGVQLRADLKLDLGIRYRGID